MFLSSNGAYCGVRFGDPLAFLMAQAAFGHRSAAGVDLHNWRLHFIRGAFGSINWNNYTLIVITKKIQTKNKIMA
ncbi:hypothetical protein [Dulcicalothrix desertica]|uniref:hypothetical protein n=1 Tax=Dulcicalothrix desertica TaxID=32056 RepID=UPI000F8D0EC1|nr:hypothetical protein [Dulcicalothrix desertica]